MRIPDTVRAIIRELWARFPPDQSSDDSRRAFMRRVGEQLGWSVGLAWGYYKTQGGGPASKDLLPYLELDTVMDAGGYVSSVSTKHGWDILVGGNGGLNLNGEEKNDTMGWVFHPVTPINHLGAPSPPIPPTPDLEARVRKLEAEQTVLRQMIEACIEALPDLLSPADPSEWEAAGKVLWLGVTLPLRRKAVHHD